MKPKKTFVLITVLIAVLVTANVAFATNRVEVKTTSESIRYHSACDKAGSLSLQFDGGSILRHGDQITIDFPFVPPGSQATLCRDIDLVIAPVNTWRYVPSTGAWTAAPAAVPLAAPAGTEGWGGVIPPTANSPVITNDGAALGTILGGVFFHIYGTAGQSRITMDIIGATWADVAIPPALTGDGIPDANSNAGPTPTLPLTLPSVTVGAAQTLTIYLLDQQTNAINFTTQPGIWADSTTANTYAVPATSTNNTLCINASNWEGSTVNVHMDSKLDKFTFVPTDPPIAHIMAGDISRYACSKETCATIQRSTQQAVCEFDNDDGTGFCLGKMNRLIIQTAGFFDSNTTYQIDAKILVNGTYSDAQGVYFSSAGIISKAYQSGTDACADSNAYLVNPLPNYYRAGGSAATPMASNPNCLIPAASRATRIITTPAALFDNPIYRYLYIDLPTLFYDSSVMKDGDKVEVEFAVLKSPCGELIRDTFCVGTFNSSCSGSAAAVNLLYPYFTPMNDDPANDDYWDGIVITNLSNTAGTANLTIYEQDGDVGTMTTPVAANSMYVNLLWSMYGSMTKTGGTGTLGDSRCYIVVCTDFVGHGFAMLANQATGESMGYLPDRTMTGLCP